MEEDIKTLNVGCGCNKWGDIRVDIEKLSTLYDEETTANVIASIEYLPFKDKSFEDVRCYHTLEHVDKPLESLKELLRVGEKVDVKVPTHNFYCMFFYGILALPLVVLWSVKDNSLKTLFIHLRGIKNWRKRSAAHKWYIKLKNAKTIKWLFLIPLEYQKIYGVDGCRALDYSGVREEKNIWNEKAKTIQDDIELRTAEEEQKTTSKKF